ncbi:hypothetical protein BgAZ_401500 [Babesia gibsoni]|uniref:Uncharacterized protein n=1 Tax=Babesia gibsoni TaxID=33632 RepID=A0AAD8LR98_BABGI|nr:hypothetical protein BgAZ_401500 [Babesia gibsoni]
MVTRVVKELSHEWARVCAELPPGAVAKSLNRIALNFAKLPHETDAKSGYCLRTFLEKHVIRVVIPSCNLKGTGRLGFRDVLDPLQRRALLLGSSGNINQKDISLVLNAYAKIYHTSQQFRGTPQKIVTERHRLLRQYVSQILPATVPLVPRMNEQDLSLVLNCASKLGVMNDELLTVANETLVTQLRQHYKNGYCSKNSSDTQRQVPDKDGITQSHTDNNILSQFTPQGVSLVVNCFAKSNVALDEGVLTFIVHHYLPKNLDRFITQQLVVMMHSLLKLKVPLKEVVVPLRHMDRVMAMEFDERKTKLLSASLYTFGKYSYMPSEMASKLDSETRDESVITFSELELCNIYYGLGKLNMRFTGFLDRLNKAVGNMLHKLSPQGLSTTYYALARLDVRDHQETQEALLSRFEELINSNHNFIESRETCSKDDECSKKILPLHVVNVCFSASTCLVLEGRLFATLLSHLEWPYRYCSTDTLGGGLRWVPWLLERKRQTINDTSKTKCSSSEFISRELGTQGVYQLYCICQHIMMYTQGGLMTQRLAVLQLLKDIFDMWEVISKDKPSTFRHETIKGASVENSQTTTLIDPDVTTSKIQDDVVSVLKKGIVDRQVKSIQPIGRMNKQQSNSKQVLLVKEAPAIPYVIDILLCSV